MTVLFHSNSKINKRGFLLTWRAVEDEATSNAGLLTYYKFEKDKC